MDQDLYFINWEHISWDIEYTYSQEDWNWSEAQASIPRVSEL